jgi:hypothetical protein
VWLTENWAKSCFRACFEALLGVENNAFDEKTL